MSIDNDYPLFSSRIYCTGTIVVGACLPAPGAPASSHLPAAGRCEQTHRPLARHFFVRQTQHIAQSRPIGSMNHRIRNQSGTHQKQQQVYTRANHRY
ncbi:MAG: hypothetical protein KDK39_15655, partial [Leptospiraceae bacterium]|nr:hypothetical protein [Leptospiraceae bacterium]